MRRDVAFHSKMYRPTRWSAKLSAPGFEPFPCELRSSCDFQLRSFGLDFPFFFLLFDL